MGGKKGRDLKPVISRGDKAFRATLLKEKAFSPLLSVLFLNKLGLKGWGRTFDNLSCQSLRRQLLFFPIALSFLPRVSSHLVGAGAACFRPCSTAAPSSPRSSQQATPGARQEETTSPAKREARARASHDMSCGRLQSKEYEV